MKLIKSAASHCGYDKSKYASHSLRRGSASAHLMSGMSLDAVRFFGRWKGENSMRGYVEEGVRVLARDFGWRALEGLESTEVVLQAQPRQRHQQQADARAQARGARR
jgi:hypothetical protein